VHRGAGRIRVPQRGVAAGKTDRDDVPEHPVAISRRTRIAAEVVVLSGSVEIAPRLGRADVNLRSGFDRLDAGREPSSAGRDRAGEPGGADPHADPHPHEKQDWTHRLLMRIDGVEQVKGSKYIMLHAPRSALPAIAKLLPGSETPHGHPPEGRGDRVRRARRVPGERVLGAARRPEERRRHVVLVLRSEMLA